MTLLFAYVEPKSSLSEILIRCQSSSRKFQLRVSVGYGVGDYCVVYLPTAQMHRILKTWLKLNTHRPTSIAHVFWCNML